MPHELSELGATEQLVAGVRSGAWRGWIGEAAEYLAAVERWGVDVIQHPKVRVGTIHSAKGAEADNVVVLTALSGPCVRGAESQAGHDEQQRVFYVGVTRARRRLIVLDDARNFMRQEMPAEGP
jgi:superfamily I DNA/RNA helicase